MPRYQSSRAAALADPEGGGSRRLQLQHPNEFKVLRPSDRAGERVADLASALVLDEPDATGFRDGDPDAVRDVYRAYGGLVFAVAHRVLGDRGLAEEAVQQTFVQAWRAAAGFDPARELGPWLATIARRVAIDLHRRESRRVHSPLDDVTGSLPAMISVPDSAESSYDAWEVRRALADLPAEERDVVRLQHLDGLTQSEIAERLNIPLGTVKSRSVRAYRRLAGTLGHLREGMA